MASGGAGTPTKSETKVSAPTGKLVLAIVEMYSSQEQEMQKLAGDLAACIIESYSDKNKMVKDILGTYMAPKLMMDNMRMQMKRQHPEESKILSEIFGIFLFGEKL